MKQLFYLLSLVIITSTTFAQSIDDVKASIGGEKWDIKKSKDLIDKYLTNPKNTDKADAWYYKGLIYNAVAKDEALKGSCNGDCKMEAFEAIKKSMELDKKGLLQALYQNAAIFDIYNTGFDMAIKAFNNKDYAGAFDNFKKAGEVEDFIVSKNLDYNGFKFPALDTSLILNTAMSARLAKNDDEAIRFYKKISDANIGGAQYLEVYEQLVEYARARKDKDALAAALAQGKKIYPDEVYWTAIEIEEVEANGGTKADVLKKYEALVQESPANNTLAYNYAVELYNYIYHNDGKPENVADNKEKLKTELQKLGSNNSTTIETKILAARFFYNSSFDNSDDAKKIRGTTPADVKKKKALNDAAVADMNACIPFAEEAVKHFESLPQLKAAEKANYRVALSMLKDIYETKKNVAKADEYDKKIKAL